MYTFQFLVIYDKKVMKGLGGAGTPDVKERIVASKLIFEKPYEAYDYMRCLGLHHQQLGNKTQLIPDNFCHQLYVYDENKNLLFTYKLTAQ